MPRPSRSEVFAPDEVAVVHCVQRCVRRAFLAGNDPVSGIDYEFRREWIRKRLELLASVFGVDVLSYAILSNHLHVVTRTRPDVVATWSDRDVATRWLRVFPGRRIEEQLAEPTTTDIDALVNNAQRLAEIRTRLSDLSWFMRALSEPIARMANKFDQCTGRFWEGRFKAQRITDEASLLACSMYVDLNPIRAAMVETPEQAEHTSAYDRIQALKGQKIASAAADVVVLETEEAGRQIRETPASQRRQQRGRSRTRGTRQILRDQWLAPLTLAERSAPGALPSDSGVRASDKGFLSMSLKDYLKLLDWTGRQGRADKRGKIPAGLASILQRLGIESEMWCDLVWNFKRYFGRSAGSPSSLRDDAARGGRRWRHGQHSVSACFVSE